jgi:colanic acid/amylovoran biosynthesis glycosyltransferase
LLTVAYIANQFPVAVEPYVADEIRELRRRGVNVIPASGRRVDLNALPVDLQQMADESICLQPPKFRLLWQAAWLCVREWGSLQDLLVRILFRGTESPARRVRALLHTWLGAYYALVIRDRGVRHIHAHHGYFASWVAMVTARLLRIGFSMTLHGSDLLLHGTYLDTKLANCSFCFTVSEYNRRYILDRYPTVDPTKIILQRIGVDQIAAGVACRARAGIQGQLLLLAVGRLHPVKNFEFLVRACALLRERGISFSCWIAGDGPERKKLDHLIRDLKLRGEVELLGHVPRAQLTNYYAMADLVVSTSHSEGIPLALMEAMAHGKLVLAPDITGIPELVIDGKTGFLFRAGSFEEFCERVEMIRDRAPGLGSMGKTARAHVHGHFDRKKNLEQLCNFFLTRLGQPRRHVPRENPLLQQV